MTHASTTRTGYRFRLVNIECLPNSANFNAIMDLDESIAELLPYLAASLPGCTYTHGTGVVNFMDEGHIVAIYANHLTITDLRDQNDAEAFCRKYFDTIQQVRANRKSITPVLQKRPSLGVLDILRALPKTNCGECGCASCMAFAARVFRREETVRKCAPLLHDAAKHRDLFHQLQLNGYQT